MARKGSHKIENKYANIKYRFDIFLRNSGKCQTETDYYGDTDRLCLFHGIVVFKSIITGIVKKNHIIVHRAKVLFFH